MKIGKLIIEKVSNFAFNGHGFAVSWRGKDKHWRKILLYKNMGNKKYLIWGKDVNAPSKEK